MHCRKEDCSFHNGQKRQRQLPVVLKDPNGHEVVRSLPSVAIKGKAAGQPTARASLSKTRALPARGRKSKNFAATAP